MACPTHAGEQCVPPRAVSTTAALPVHNWSYCMAFPAAACLSRSATTRHAGHDSTTTGALLSPDGTDKIASTVAALDHVRLTFTFQRIRVKPTTTKIRSAGRSVAFTAARI